VFIASYTITDGLGARINGDAIVYAAWLFLLNGLMMLLLLLAMRGVKLGDLRPYRFRAILGGGMIICAYGIVIWAMTVAPIALVAAVRESSVLWAAVISTIVLREPFSRWRLVSGIAIVCGIALTRIP
jgi:drug/metabolite transporter (DMT)-like permease